jgi:hypothetical protein
MFEISGYSVSCTPRKYLLICQLCCEQWLPFGLIHLAGSWAQCGAPSLLCATGDFGLRLRVVPSVVELFLLPLLQ